LQQRLRGAAAERRAQDVRPSYTNVATGAKRRVAHPAHHLGFGRRVEFRPGTAEASGGVAAGQRPGGEARAPGEGGGAPAAEDIAPRPRRAQDAAGASLGVRVRYRVDLIPTPTQSLTLTLALALALALAPPP
jgi:hypothetical protein